MLLAVSRGLVLSVFEVSPAPTVDQCTLLQLCMHILVSAEKTCDSSVQHEDILEHWAAESDECKKRKGPEIFYLNTFKNILDLRTSAVYRKRRQ